MILVAFGVFLRIFLKLARMINCGCSNVGDKTIEQGPQFNTSQIADLLCTAARFHVPQ